MFEDSPIVGHFKWKDLHLSSVGQLTTLSVGCQTLEKLRGESIFIWFETILLGIKRGTVVLPWLQVDAIRGEYVLGNVQLLDISSLLSAHSCKWTFCQHLLRMDGGLMRQKQDLREHLLEKWKIWHEADMF